jgi:N-acetylglutamate synthase-like GNAT family acetyltransferase
MSKNSMLIRSDLRPGDIGSIIYLHGILYAREYGFDHTFEPYVAAPLAEFVKNQTDRERIWIVEKEEQVVGSIAIVQFSQNQAQLRWLILDPVVRGRGIGKRLVEEAVDFCRTSGYSSIFLWTIDFLGAALKLYKTAGFELTDTNAHPVWGRILTEERYELKLK